MASSGRRLLDIEPRAQSDCRKPGELVSGSGIATIASFCYILSSENGWRPWKSGATH
jgi:hypothetical protein